MCFRIPLVLFLGCPNRFTCESTSAQANSPLTAFVLAVGSTSCVAVSIRRDTKKCHSFAPLLLLLPPERKSYVQGLISTEERRGRRGGPDRRTRTEWETELVRGMSVPNEANANGHRGQIAFLSYLHRRMYFFAGRWVLSSATEQQNLSESNPVYMLGKLLLLS